MSQLLRYRALEIARAERDKRVRADEGDRLDGTQIREYLKSVGASPRNDYCVAFVYWCYRQAAGQLGCANILPKTASTSLFKSWAPKSWFLSKDQLPEPGDIYLRSDLGHTGMVNYVKDGRLETKTVEGNTWVVPYNWGVHGRTRNLKNAYVLRPTW